MNYTDKKILFFIGTLECGGAERVISILAPCFLDKFKSVEVLTYYDNEDFYILSSNVKRSSLVKMTSSKNMFKNFLYFRKYIKKNCDIIISFTTKFNILSVFASIGLKKRVIISERSDPSKVPNNILLKLLRNVAYRNANGIVFQTRTSQSYFSKKVQDKSTVIYNPVSLDYSADSNYMLESKKNRIICVGRLIPIKNHKMVITAFSKLEKLFPDYSLFIYGEGPERDSLNMLIQSEKLQNKVFLPGEIDYIKNELEDCKLFVLSSNYEGMSNALIEAMCVGVPIISTNVNCAKELIEDGYDGILVEVNNTNMLAESIKKVLSSNNYQKYLSNNVKKKREMFSLNNIIKRWLMFIENVNGGE